MKQSLYRFTFSTDDDRQPKFTLHLIVKNRKDAERTGNQYIKIWDYDSFQFIEREAII